MYNRYIPKDTSYTRVTEEKAPVAETKTAAPEQNSAQPQRHARGTVPPPRPAPGNCKQGGFALPSFLRGKDGLGTLFAGKDGAGLTGLLKSLRMEEIDSGDILLMLILLYLLVEGDDLDLVIALGLVLILGLGEKKTGEDST